MSSPRTPADGTAQPAKWPRAIALLAGSYAVIGGAITLTGWALGVEVLTAWKSDGISMFPNTAVCAVASGLALLLSGSRSGPRVAAPLLLGGLAAMVGGLTLAQHLTGIDLGIDRLLFSNRPWGQAAAAAPMRMGPPASVSFLAIGVAMILLNLGPRARGASAMLAVAVVAIATLSVTGHLYGAQQMYTIPRLTGIAMQAASILLALGVGVVASVTEREPMRTLIEPSAAGMVARRALPVIALMAVLFGWGRVVIQDRDLVDTAFGTALRTLVELALLTGLLWWAVAKVRAHERALAQSEAEVRRQAGQLAAFLQTAAIGIHRVGPDGIILWANDAELEMLGYAREEYVGHHIADFHVDRANIAELLERVRGGERVLEYPAQLSCKDGSIKSVLIDSSALWEDGRFVHTQCFTRDVTDRKRAEAEREESSRRKDEFIAILAHELRNPLAPLRNAARYLKLKDGTDPAVQRSVDMIERQVRQMSRLIDDLLDVSRITRGMLELRRERVSASEVIEAATDACRHELDAKRQSLRTTLPATRVELEADRERLIQIVSNLVGNAAKYTPAGGTIELAVTASDGVLHVSVKDDGIGIPSAKLEEIFDLFARVDDALDRQGGLGIGLTLVRQLVELHGGTITAKSDGIGHGSEFVLNLPVEPVEVDGTTAAGDVADPRPVRVPLRILVADDNADAVESLALLLETWGHEVHTAFDGEAAILAAESLVPHVALLDIGMPKANGYQVAQRIRAEPWGARVYLVALTGWGQETDKRRARDAGFDAHLTKPVPPDVLEELLAALACEGSVPAHGHSAS